MDDRISIDDDKRLDALVEKAERQGEIVLTRSGTTVARIVAVRPVFDRAQARQALQNIIRIGDGISLGDGLRFKDLVNEGRKY